jgi:hypothetical protein
MKRMIVLLGLSILSLAALSIFGCRSKLLYPEDVKAVKLAWVPNKELRASRMEIELDEAIRNIFVDKLSESEEIQPVWITNLILFEGSYEITVTKKDGTSHYYQFGGDSILFSPSAKTYYQNKDLHLFIYQILFREFARRKIRLDEPGRSGK